MGVRRECFVRRSASAAHDASCGSARLLLRRVLAVQESSTAQRCSFRALVGAALARTSMYVNE